MLEQLQDRWRPTRDAESRHINNNRQGAPTFSEDMETRWSLLWKTWTPCQTAQQRWLGDVQELESNYTTLCNKSSLHTHHFGNAERSPRWHVREEQAGFRNDTSHAYHTATLRIITESSGSHLLRWLHSFRESLRQCGQICHIDIDATLWHS